MLPKLSLCALLLLSTGSALAARRGPFISFYPESSAVKLDASQTGAPLFLTPHINNGDIEKAQQLSRVDLKPRIDSHSGYITVNDVPSHLFFWYFPALSGSKSAPLVVWLQGGPGSSSMFGLFVENGPYKVDSELNLQLRNSTWAQNFDMVFIDQPAGTGFSFTENEKGYRTNQEGVADDLYAFFVQFYQLFPDLLQRELYITGESYAGKYVPSIAYRIHEENEKNQKEGLIIPLKGLAIGDGLSDPYTQIDVSLFLYSIGLLDVDGAEQVSLLAEHGRQLIEHQHYLEASDVFNTIFDLYSRETQLNFVYNYLLAEEPASFTYFETFLQKSEVRKALHAGNVDYVMTNDVVYEHMFEDMSKSVKPVVEKLLNEDYRILIYNGQLDVIVAYEPTDIYVQSLQWKGQQDLLNSDRIVWKSDDKIAGYAKQVGNFTWLMVRNAGHILPFDQPQVAFDMIERFVNNVSFGEDEKP